MKIIILGAGQVGSSVAENLASEANDITVVDRNPDQLRTLQEHFDLRTVTGWASHPDVLARAGAEDADMIVAVTSSDETNMIACQVAYSLFHTPTKIARVRAAEYLSHASLFKSETLPIDVLISPEQVTRRPSSAGLCWGPGAARWREGVPRRALSWQRAAHLDRAPAGRGVANRRNISARSVDHSRWRHGG